MKQVTQQSRERLKISGREVIIRVYFDDIIDSIVPTEDINFDGLEEDVEETLRIEKEVGSPGG